MQDQKRIRWNMSGLVLTFSRPQESDTIEPEPESVITLGLPDGVPALFSELRLSTSGMERENLKDQIAAKLTQDLAARGFDALQAQSDIFAQFAELTPDFAVRSEFSAEPWKSSGPSDNE